MQFLLAAVLLLYSTSVCAQVTPGDEDASCVASLQGSNDIPGVKMLLDSRHYNQLLGTSGAVWDQIDFDDNNPVGFINPTYVSHTPYQEYFSALLLEWNFILCSCLFSVETQCWWFVSMVCHVMWLHCWGSG